MAKKKDLIITILRELRKAQTERWTPPPSGPVKRLHLPPTLPLGNGRHLNATDALLKAVSAYAKLCWDNDPTLKPRFKVEEFTKLADDAFAQVLLNVDLEQSDENLSEGVNGQVQQHLEEQVSRHHRAIELTLGCHLFEGNDAYPIRVGPVIFEARQQWRQRASNEGKLSPVAARRIDACWSGRALTKRKPSYDADVERAIMDAIGSCPVICSVATDGLSSKYIEEKGLLAARIAMTALSLTWERPSQGLKWMNLLYDRLIPHRHTVSFGQNRIAGISSSTTQLPAGRWTDAELLSDLRSRQWLFDQAGEALYNYVQPTRNVTRPKLMNALFLSLWWYHEACREPLDQIATTKFAASMDAIVVGQSANAIVQLLCARWGFKPDGKLMTDGRTTKSVIANIYDAGRSRLIHGSSDNFAHDWTEVRSAAEAVGRLCLIGACEWLSENPVGDDLKALSQP